MESCITCVSQRPSGCRPQDGIQHAKTSVGETCMIEHGRAMGARVGTANSQCHEETNRRYMDMAVVYGKAVRNSEESPSQSHQSDELHV